MGPMFLMSEIRCRNALQAAYDEPLDDLIVDGRGADVSISRLSLQTKRELTISAATTNTDFREIITRAWVTAALLGKGWLPAVLRGREEVA